MVERGSDSVINVASLNGLLGFPLSTAYGSAKGGLVVFTRDMAIELASSRVRINCVCPGVTDADDGALDRLNARQGGGTGNAARRHANWPHGHGQWPVLYCFSPRSSTLCPGSSAQCRWRVYRAMSELMRIMFGKGYKM